MFHQQELNAGEVVGHIEHIEITYAGQAFRLGRYPIHFHINGDMNGSYVRGCAIHHTFNRAVNIHHTDNILVENNVVYDVMGGALFLEDSIEVGNIFQYNLAIFVRSSSSLLNDDITPAGFWITHPDNIVRHNHVAGGTHFGFWYRMLDHPQGPSYTPDICPQNVPLGEFYNNTVHSVGWYGLWVFEYYTPKVGGKCGATVPAPAVFRNLTTWNSFRGAEWVEAYPMQFHGFVLANNFMAGTEHYFNRGIAPQYTEDGAMVKDTVIIAHLNSPNHPPCTKRGIVLPLDGGLLYDGITFVNFDGERNGNHICSGIGTVKIVCICHVLCAGYNYKFKNIKWLNSSKKAFWEWEHQAELEDLDGTLTGRGAGARAMAKSNLFPSQCVKETEWSPNMEGMVCRGDDEAIDVIRWSFNDAKPETLMFKDLRVQNKYGTSITKFRAKGNSFPSGWMLLLVSGLPHNISFINMEHIANISYRGKFYGLEVGIAMLSLAWT